MKAMLRLLIVLFIACFIAAGSLALVNLVTQKPIGEYEIIEKNRAKQSVHPTATSFRELEKDRVWEALRDDRVIGRVISVEIQGYGGPIKLMYGINNENRITEVKVLSQSETPGLGARITDPVFLSQFTSQDAAAVALKKAGGGAPGRALAGTLYRFPTSGPQTNAPGVDAITGATISSRAVINAVRQSMAASSNQDAESDATEEKQQ